MRVLLTILLFASCTKEIELSAKGGKKNQPPVIVDTIPKPPPVITSAFLATPRVGDQGNEGSCNAWAVVHAAMIENYYRTGIMKIFSCEYVYNQSKMTYCTSGTSFSLALGVVKNKGVCMDFEMPEVDNECATQPTALQDSLAAQNKITGWATLLNTDKAGIKAKIIAKKPVMIAVLMDNSFINATQGFVWRTYSGSGALPHSMVIVGFDDSKNAWKVMNCWGTAWADGGFSWIDYDFFPVKTGFNVYYIL